MKHNFLNLFAVEASTQIEYLTGQRPTITLKETELVSIITNIIPPVSTVRLRFAGPEVGTGMVFTPSLLATTLGNMMLGGDGEGKEIMADEDLDAIKEIVSNIVGAMSTSLAIQTTLPDFIIKTEDAEFIAEEAEINLDGFSRLFTFSFRMGSIESLIMLAIDDVIFKALSSASIDPVYLDYKLPTRQPTHEEIDDKQLVDNLNRVKDILVEVKVRIGQKTMTMDELSSLKANDPIELNQLANDPIEILVNNETFGFGEAVIVDGNYGVQITFLGDRESFKKARTNVNS